MVLSFLETLVQMSSFTSNFERSLPDAREPWAISIALVMLVLLEVMINWVPERDRIGYTPALGAYYEVKHYVETFGASDIGILGSSRGRESVAVPYLREICERQTGKPIEISNYSCASIRSCDVEHLAKMLLKSRKTPQMLIYVVSPFILHDEKNRDKDKYKQLFALDKEDLENINEQIESIDDMVSHYALKLLWENYKTFRHRMRFHALLIGIARGRMPSSPIRGEYTMWHRYNGDRNLEKSGLTAGDAQRYVSNFLNENGEYILGNQNIHALEKTIAFCKKAKVEIVLIEAPIAEMLKDAYPTGLYSEFLDTIRKVCADSGVKFLRLKELGVQLSDYHYREYSHLNLNGAKVFTDAIAESVILPFLKSE